MVKCALMSLGIRENLIAVALFAAVFSVVCGCGRDDGEDAVSSATPTAAHKQIKDAQHSGAETAAAQQTPAESAQAQPADKRKMRRDEERRLSPEERRRRQISSERVRLRTEIEQLEARHHNNGAKMPRGAAKRYAKACRRDRMLAAEEKRLAAAGGAAVSGGPEEKPGGDAQGKPHEDHDDIYRRAARARTEYEAGLDEEELSTYRRRPLSYWVHRERVRERRSRKAELAMRQDAQQNFVETNQKPETPKKE